MTFSSDGPPTAPHALLTNLARRAQGARYRNATGRP
ncbi:hypothetical protein Y025_5590 [Burkholderia pseudomallei TSV32]|nr:hypothetical protein Y025_5590 [Burkholderia pseudomallei TSV32]